MFFKRNVFETCLSKIIYHRLMGKMIPMYVKLVLLGSRERVYPSPRVNFGLTLALRAGGVSFEAFHAVGLVGHAFTDFLIRIINHGLACIRYLYFKLTAVV